MASGSPPRMRGKEKESSKANSTNGITPAYAGKSGQRPSAHLCRQDHPRVCGEKSVFSWSQSTLLGSPPRMRGKERVAVSIGDGIRITPAYAGKSTDSRYCSAAGWDHPRVCGEKDLGQVVGGFHQGSPPRMRGKAACSAADDRCKKDHPRVCGEKFGYVRLCLACFGSPPRMRGKGADQTTRRVFPGITPAYAGKRLAGIPSMSGIRDHPRVCGEKTKKIP